MALLYSRHHGEEKKANGLTTSSWSWTRYPKLEMSLCLCTAMIFAVRKAHPEPGDGGDTG